MLICRRRPRLQSNGRILPPTDLLHRWHRSLVTAPLQRSVAMLSSPNNTHASSTQIRSIHQLARKLRLQLSSSTPVLHLWGHRCHLTELSVAQAVSCTDHSLSNPHPFLPWTITTGARRSSLSLILPVAVSGAIQNSCQ